MLLFVSIGNKSRHSVDKDSSETFRHVFYQVQVGNSCMEVVVGAVHSGWYWSIMDVSRDKELERSVASVAVGPISWAKVSGLLKEKSMFQNTKQPAVEWEGLHRRLLHDATTSDAAIANLQKEYLITG